MYKPENYNSLSAYLMVDGAKRLAILLKNIFDATEKRVYHRADGSIMHMEVMIDDTVLMISDATENYPAQKIMLHVYVPDVIKTFELAVASGCESIEVPVNKPNDPDKRGMFADFAGNVWAIATQQN